MDPLSAHERQRLRRRVLHGASTAFPAAAAAFACPAILVPALTSDEVFAEPAAAATILLLLPVFLVSGSFTFYGINTATQAARLLLSSPRRKRPDARSTATSLSILTDHNRSSNEPDRNP